MRQILFISLSVFFVVLIVIFQIYVIYNTYLLQEEMIQTELDLILEQSYKKDLDRRIGILAAYRTDTIVEINSPNDHVDSKTKIAASYNMDGAIEPDKNGSDFISKINLAIGQYANTQLPLDVQVLDSIVSRELKKKKLLSEFGVYIMNEKGAVLQQSKNILDRNSSFIIYSKQISLTFEQPEFLQLMLVNPRSDIFRRLSLLIASSLLFSFFCIGCLWYLHRLFSKQRKLTDTKNEFFSHVSHELRRPVSQIRVAIGELCTDRIIEDESKRNRYLNISNKASTEISDKIDMIMALSMDEEGVFRLNYSDFNLAEAICPLAERFELASEKQVNIIVDNQLTNPLIRADKDHLIQCVANLIENAVKYSGNPLVVNLTLRSADSQIIISVRDNGLGMDKEKIPTILDKYNRLNPSDNNKQPGLGIGLHYVKKIIEKHSGRIEVNSEYGGGSEFVLYIPLK